MDKKGLFIGLGSAGKSQLNKIIFEEPKEPENPTFVIVDCTETKSESKIIEIKKRTDDKVDG